MHLKLNYVVFLSKLPIFFLVFAEIVFDTYGYPFVSTKVLIFEIHNFFKCWLCKVFSIQTFQYENMTLFSTILGRNYPKRDRVTRHTSPTTRTPPLTTRYSLLAIRHLFLRNGTLQIFQKKKLFKNFVFNSFLLNLQNLSVIFL